MHKSGSESDSLLSRLKQACREKIPIHKVEAFVGLKSIINTQRPGERDSLLAADIGPDNRYQTILPDFRSAKEVIYWQNAEVDITEAVAVAGLLEKQDGRIELFYALVYTPE